MQLYSYFTHSFDLRQVIENKHDLNEKLKITDKNSEKFKELAGEVSYDDFSKLNIIK